MECPVCRSYSSSVLAAVVQGDPCPSCGTPANVILDVERLRTERGDAELKAKVEELMIELGKVTADRDRLARIVEGVRCALDDEN